MSRSTQSRESGIVAYFKTVDLAIAVVVLGLAIDAVKERKAKSSEARDRALKAHAPKPKAKDPVGALSAPVAPKPKRRKKRAKKAQSAATLETPSVYSEEDLNG